MKLLFALAIFLTFCTSLQAQGEFLNNSSYCGIYSIYGAASALGKESEFESLVSEKFVSSRQGSSNEDLQKAAKFLDIKLTEYRSLGKESLKSCKDPMILHVASSGQLLVYNHWILFLGTTNGQANILDSRRGVRQISLSDLCARWDGAALVAHVGDAPNVDYRHVELKSGLLNTILICLAVILGIFLSRAIIPKKMQPVAVFAFAIIVCGFFYAFDSNSVVRSYKANQYILGTLKKKHFETLEYAELKKKIESPNSFVLVDARSQPAFFRQSIETAINLPVEISDADLEDLTAEFDRGFPIVVYCQSRSCSFDEVIAMRLNALGFTNITLYEGGFNDWIRRSKEKQKAT